NEGDLVEVDTLTIGQRFRDRGFAEGLVDELKIFNRELTPLEVLILFQDFDDPSGSPSPEYQGGGFQSAAKPASGSYDRYLHNQDAEYQKGLEELRDIRK